MDLTSEQVHWIGGGAFVLVALALIAYESGAWQRPWLRWSLPVLLVGYALESFADLWVHGTAQPLDYGPESAQHLLQGAAVLIAGVVEALRLRERLRAAAFGLVLPAALLVVAGVFWWHAQHDAGVAPDLLIAQHRAFALSLTVAALARALSLIPRLAERGFALAWLLPLLVFGLQLLVYTEQSGAMAHAGH